jgi:adenylate cyclase
MVFAGVTFLGSHAAAFTYLLVERALRPTMALALVRSQPVRLEILSVKNRFLLAFAFGPGITIAGIALFLTIRAPGGGDLAPAVWPVVALGLVDGYVLVALAAASVTGPMEDVRLAMKRVLDGDLNADVPVDAGSEVGLLQVGFNRMLGGLRERELLRQLLGRSAGDDVAERLVSHGVDFEGTEMQASVLMVDLIGSTPMTESDAAEVLTTLNCLFDTVVRITSAHGGWVNRFVGDAALCVFGAPVASDDHATRVLAAARALCDELLVLRKERPWLDVGVGVSSGRVIAANVGTAMRFEFTVIGDAVNEAARLTEVAKRSATRLVASGAAVAEAAGTEAASWVSAGDVHLRGKRNATPIFEPLGSLAAAVDDGAPTWVDRLGS